MDFYDELAPLYHLIFPDWHTSVGRQAAQLDAVIRATWPGAGRLLDVSCGIGTQAIGLAGLGYDVSGSDLSAAAVARAREEAQSAGVELKLSVGDMLDAHALHGSGFDVVVSCDNSVPHLLQDEDILAALRQMHLCLRPGGGCLVSVRDYAKEERGRNLVKHYGVRVQGERRYIPLQVWDFDEGGAHYDLSFIVVEEDLRSHAATTHVMRSRYYAIGIDRLLALMSQAGFVDLRRLDDAFYQPLLVGTRPR